MAEIKLDDMLLSLSMTACEKDIKINLDAILVNMRRRFNNDEDIYKAEPLAKKVMTLYGGVYYSLKTKMRSQMEKTSGEEDSLLRAFWAYASAEAVIQLLDTDTSASSSAGSSLNLRGEEPSIRYSYFDKTTLQDVAAAYSDTFLTLSSLRGIKEDLSRYFETVSRISADQCMQGIAASLYDKCKGINISGSLVGKRFSVDGIKRRTEIVQEQKPASKGRKDIEAKRLKPATFKHIRKEDIVGNSEAIERIETEASCLMRYCTSERRNPYEGFEHMILYAGRKGTGKTMIAHYAMSLASDIAKQAGKPFEAVELNFASMMQCGPEIYLTSQLEEVANSNKAYILFVDEFDTKIPSRMRLSGGDHKDDVAGVFLRFRGGGFANNGNYMLIATTNCPGMIDPPILDAFFYQEIEGPATAAEKLKVLYNNLRRGIDSGSVDINGESWQGIGQLMHDNNLSGREIVNVADSACERFRQTSKRIADESGASSYKLAASQVEKEASKLLHSQGSQYVTRSEDVIKSVMEQVRKRDMQEISYLAR